MTNATTRTSDFLASLGVNTHVNYTDGGYANVTNVANDLAYLGITAIRDHISDGAGGSAPLSSYIALARKGITFTVIIGDGVKTTADLQAQLTLVQRLIAAVPGSVTALEGPNEVNNWPVTYNGVSGLAGAIALQKDLYAAVHGNSAFTGVAVDYFTGYPSRGTAGSPDPSTTAGLADYDTQHPYPNNGDAPAGWVDPAKALDNETPGHFGSFVYTETGYSSNGGTAGAVSLAVQAKYTLDLLFDTYKDGASRTDLYELMDAYAAGSPQGNDGYGLFAYGNTAKPVAEALHNLTTLLADTGAAAKTFATASFAPTITGLPSTGNSLVLEKANGTYDVVLWAEPKIWDKATGQEVTAAASTVTVDLGATYAAVSVYDPLTGTTALSTQTNARTIVVSVTDHPLILEVAGGVVTPVVTPVSSTGGSGSSASSGTTSSGGTTATAPSTSTSTTTTGSSSSATGSSSSATPATTGGSSGQTSSSPVPPSSSASTPGTGAATPVVVTVQAFSALKSATGVTIQDTAANVAAALGTLKDRASAIGSIVLTSGALDVVSATALAKKSVLDKIVGGFTVSDTSTAILRDLAGLSADSAVTSISTTGPVTVSVAQFLANRSALDKLVYRFGLVDTATNFATIGLTDTATNIASVSGVIAGDTQISSVTTVNASGVAVAKDLYNADGSLKLHETIVTAADGSVTNHVTGGSVLAGQAYARYDEVVGANGKTLSRTYYASNGQALSAGLWNPDGSLKMWESMSRDGSGRTTTHMYGGSTFDGTPQDSANQVSDASGALLWKDTTMRNGTHQFLVQADNQTVTANRNDSVTLLGRNETVVLNASGAGHETFSGFGQGDVLSFANKPFTSFAALMAHTSGTTDAVIAVSATNAVTLTGVAPSSLTAAMFKLG